MEFTTIDQFIDELIKQAQLDNLPADFQAQFRQSLAEQIDRRIGLIVMENLDEAGLAQFAQLMENESKPDLTKIEAMFADKIPDLSGKIQQGLIELAAEFVSAAQK